MAGATAGTTADTASGWRRFWERGGFWRAVLLAAVYLALYLGAGRLIDAIWGDLINPEDVLSSTASVFFGLVLPILIGIVLLFAFAASIGWTRRLFARQPIGGRWWMWILPVVVLVYNVIRFAAVDYSRYTVSTVILVLFLGLCIGVAEETLTRGFAVDLLRRAGHRELVVALLSSLIFAASHATNLFSGQPVLTVGLTIVYTFAFGIAMYFTLRVTRSLIGPILLHASTDPSGLLLAGGVDKATGTAAPSVLASVAGTSNWVVIALGLILVWFIRDRLEASRPVPPA